MFAAMSSHRTGGATEEDTTLATPQEAEGVCVPVAEAGPQEIVRLPRAEGTSYAVTIQPTVPFPGPASESVDGSGESAPAPVVLVVPAMGMKAGYYGPLLTALATSGVHAATTELRGHEEQGGRKAGRDYDFDNADLLDDLDRAVAAVRGRLPGSPVLLLGHSMGGQLATAYAATHRDVAGLLLVASGSPYWRAWSRRMLYLSQVAPVIARLRGHFPGDQLKFAGREARSMMADWAHYARTGDFRAGTQQYGAQFAAADLPVLAISLEGDDLTTAESVDTLTDSLTSASVTRHHLVPEDEEINHFRWARRPETVLPVVRDWLQSVGPLLGTR